VIAFVILAAVVIAGTLVIERHMQITKPPHARSAAASAVAVAGPDSAITADTAFDVNKPAAPAVAPLLAERQPVSADPTLFPTRSRLAVPDAPGYVRVLARGGTARVRIDGRMYGFAPLIVRVGPGTHVVSLESSGDAFLPAQITVAATSNDTVSATFSARLSAADTPARDDGRQPFPATAAPSVPAASSTPSPAADPAATAPDQTGNAPADPSQP
jgi:hypothetical protein